MNALDYAKKNGIQSLRGKRVRFASMENATADNIYPEIGTEGIVNYISDDVFDEEVCINIRGREHCAPYCWRFEMIDTELENEL